MLELVIDVLIVILLVALIALGIVLRSRLERLRGPKGELRELISALDAATARAEEALAEFKRCTSETGTTVKEARAQLTALGDDLRLLTERADREADRLAELVSSARRAGPGPAHRAMSAELAEAVPDHDQVELERALRTLR